MRISDWSSDVCSSDLGLQITTFATPAARRQRVAWTAFHRDLRLEPHPTVRRTRARPCDGRVAAARRAGGGRARECHRGHPGRGRRLPRHLDRKGGGLGKSVDVRVAHGGRGNIKTKKNKHSTYKFT